MKTLDLTRPVRQKNGLSAWIISTTSKSKVSGHSYPLSVDYELHSGEIAHASFTLCGELYAGEEDGRNLKNIPEKRTLDCWVNIYPETSMRFDTRIAADDYKSNRIACIHIVQEYEVGEGL